MRNDIYGFVNLIHLHLTIVNHTKGTYKEHQTTEDTLERADMKWTLYEIWCLMTDRELT
jgi:hypothetical protein